MKNDLRMMLAVCAAVVLTTAAAAVAPPQEPYPAGVSGEARWTLQGDTTQKTGETCSGWGSREGKTGGSSIRWGESANYRANCAGNPCVS